MSDQPGVKVSLLQLREILGDEYLANRPSYDRAHARVKKASGIEMTREDFDRLKSGLRNLEELLNEGKVDRSKFKVRKYTVNSWGKHGDNYQVKAHLVPIEDAPTLAEIRPAPIADVRVRVRDVNKGMEILSIPDLHFGYKRKGKAMVPLHSEACLSLYLQIARHHQPELIVLHGDNLDLPAISKYLTSNDVKLLIQPAIDRLGEWLQSLRAACPRARIVYLAGNHEQRVDTSMLTFLPEIYGLARAGEDTPVMAVPYLLHCDRLNVEYVAPYGKSLYSHDIRFDHGRILGSKGGETVSKLLSKHKRSVITGHTHRAEIAWETIHDENGSRQVFAMTVGVGAHIDGRLPGDDEPNWQQACGSVWKGGFPFLHIIRDGQCIVGSTLFTAEVADE